MPKRNTPDTSDTTNEKASTPLKKHQPKSEQVFTKDEVIEAFPTIRFLIVGALGQRVPMTHKAQPKVKLAEWLNREDRQGYKEIITEINKDITKALAATPYTSPGEAFTKVIVHNAGAGVVQDTQEFVFPDPDEDSNKTPENIKTWLLDKPQKELMKVLCKKAEVLVEIANAYKNDLKAAEIHWLNTSNSGKAAEHTLEDSSTDKGGNEDSAKVSTPKADAPQVNIPKNSNSFFSADSSPKNPIKADNTAATENSTIRQTF